MLVTTSSAHEPSHPWHALAAPAVLKTLRVSGAGLTAGEAQARFAQYGPNTVPTGAVRGHGQQDCPSSHPVKGNADSGLYHVPGSSSYSQTIPEFCFTTAQAAEAAGFEAP